MSFHICTMLLFLWNTKEYILKNVGIQTVLVTIDFHWILLTIKINRNQNFISFQTYILFITYNFFFNKNLNISHTVMVYHKQGQKKAP